MNKILEEHMNISLKSTDDCRKMLHIEDKEAVNEWSLNYAGNIYAVALFEIEMMQASLIEIYRLASLPADGSELRDGESDDPMTLLMRISQIAKSVLED